MQYAQLNSDGTYSHQITTSGAVLWDENNFCSAESLIIDGKGELFMVVELLETEPPEVDSLKQKVIRDGGEFLNGKWHYHWRVDELNKFEIEAKEKEQATDIRAQRNKLLSECDWTQIPDSTVDKAAWLSYRHDLRFLTKQAGFPWSVEWPKSP